MKIVAAQLFALRIPFVEAFAHSVRSRTYSDSIVVRLEAEDGTVGYGEGVARPYVTGETVSSCLSFMQAVLWPAVQQIDYARPAGGLTDGINWLDEIVESLPQAWPDGPKNDSVIAWNAAVAGWELALVDCLLKSAGKSLGEVLPPQRPTVTYSGVITASDVTQAVKMAKRFKQLGISHVKVKVTGEGDRERVAAIRDVVGPAVSLRLDGNGAYTVDSAIATCQVLSDLAIDSAEQMLPRDPLAALAAVQAAAPISQMADESLITFADAKALIAANACGWFNLRISKCGGLAQTIRLARLAQTYGIRVQLGCQVGETAILSAAGRHLAAWLPNVEFVEGSYGKLLLSQDISRQPIHFGYGGKAPVLTRPGLGMAVQDDLLATYAHKAVSLEAIAC
ncbi:MAG: mandelate racemase/muconate lactonizing enzyme family protein [Phormidesmis sp.]